MRLPNWFRIIWWLALAVILTAYLIARRTDLIAGRSSPADLIVMVVWLGLLLAPVFQEVEIFGIRFKQEIQKAKEELKSEIHSVRAELRNAIDVRTTISPQFIYPAPPPDYQLPDLEDRVRAAVADALAAQGVRPSTVAPAQIEVADDVTFLFAVRYGIERELRRLARERQLDVGVRPTSGLQLSRALVQAGVIEPQLDRAVREVYAVASAGVHAEDVSDAQIGFVRDVGPQLIAALRAIGGTSAQRR